MTSDNKYIKIKASLCLKQYINVYQCGKQNKMDFTFKLSLFFLPFHLILIIFFQKTRLYIVNNFAF